MINLLILDDSFNTYLGHAKVSWIVSLMMEKNALKTNVVSYITFVLYKEFCFALIMYSLLCTDEKCKLKKYTCQQLQLHSDSITPKSPCFNCIQNDQFSSFHISSFCDMDDVVQRREELSTRTKEGASSWLHTFHDNEKWHLGFSTWQQCNKK